MDKWILKRKTIPFTLASCQMNYLSIKLTNYIQDLCEVCYTSLMKEIKVLSKWRDIPVLWKRR